MGGSEQQKLTFSDYEIVTRNLRWLIIVTMLICFPYGSERAILVYILASAAMLFNFSRYVPLFMRSKRYSSPLTGHVADNILVAALLGLVGGVATPFTGFLLFITVAAAYMFRIRGVLIAVGLQMAWLTTILINNQIFQPAVLDNLSSGIASVSVLIGLAIFVERLTRVQHDEKEGLKQLTTELEKESKHLLALVNSLSDAIFVVDTHGIIRQCNTAAQALSPSASNLVNEPFADVMPLRGRVHAKDSLVNLLQESQQPQRRRDLCIEDDNGAITDLDITVQPIRIDVSQTTDFIVVCKDITKERSLDEQRNEFISVASHELKTPIAIMEAALSVLLLAKEKYDPQTLKLIDQAHTHSIFLGSIVKDLSILAEANNDNLPIQLSQVDIKQLLPQIASDFETMAKEKGLKVKAVIEEGTPTVLTTENYIREILQNYMTNALKYTPEGGRVTLRAELSKRGGVLFSVLDTGIGISPSDQKHLFSKFFRSEDFRTRQTGGTGLGLYLCMEIAQRLNAKLWCESELNKGSIFYLEVPPMSQLKRDQGEVVKAEVANLVEGI